MRGEINNRIEFLATALAGAEHRRTAASLALLSVLICALLAPFAAIPGPVIPAFIPGYESALIIGDGITALLLLGQFRELRRPSLLVLGCGYLFTALTVVAHMLSFPGLIDAAGLIGGLQTTVWLYVFWHALFPLFVVGYAVLAQAPPLIEPSLRWSRNALAIGAGVCTVSLLVGGCVLLTTAGHGLLPTLMDGDQYRPGVTRPALAVPWTVTLLALAVLVWKTRLRRVLDLWLAMALGAWLIEILLSALLNSGRYQLGFYAGRLYGLFAANVVLAMLLMETISLYGRLAHSLAEARIQADELARAQASLQQMRRLEAVGQLTGGIAHDFNNLLTVITGSLELLLQNNNEPTRVRRFAKTALGGAERGRRLTQQLLTFARRQVTRPETVNPNRLITELTPLLRRGAGEQVEIVTDLSPILDPVNIDPAEFEAALLNLVINARDAMEGSGRVTIGTGNAELTSTDLAESRRRCLVAMC